MDANQKLELTQFAPVVLGAFEMLLLSALRKVEAFSTKVDPKFYPWILIGVNVLLSVGGHFLLGTPMEQSALESLLASGTAMASWDAFGKHFLHKK